MSTQCIFTVCFDANKQAGRQGGSRRGGGGGELTDGRLIDRQVTKVVTVCVRIYSHVNIPVIR